MSEKIKYSFKDKFLSLENEKRIGRLQFIVRFYGILISLKLIGLLIIFFSMKNSYFLEALINYSLIFGLLTIIFYMIIGTRLIQKRCHDFNSKGKTQMGFFYFFIVFSIIDGILIYMGITTPTDKILNTIIFLLTLQMIFTKGTKGPNDYGDDTSNVKIGFLG